MENNRFAGFFLVPYFYLCEKDKHMSDLGKIRDEYRFGALDKKSVDKNPIRQFEKWFNEVVESGFLYPNTMSVATCGADMKPSSRMVLLKEFDDAGFVFYTNLNSKKAGQIKQNHFAALLFFWDKLGRQIRIEGWLNEVPAAMADQYFESRPEKSKASAIVSPQSEHIPDRNFLEDRYHKLLESEDKLLKPEHWGGYRLNPDYFEFWQGREDRMHDRISYTKDVQSWIIERLAP